MGNNPLRFYDTFGLFELYGYQNRGSGYGWQSQFEFNFNPISEAPSDIAQRLSKGVNRLKKLIDFINTEPAEPLHPYKDYLQCGLLDKDLKNEFDERFKNQRLTRDEALDYLNGMWMKYPQMRELYPNPTDMVNTAERNSKDN